MENSMFFFSITLLNILPFYGLFATWQLFFSLAFDISNGYAGIKACVCEYQFKVTQISII